MFSVAFMTVFFCATAFGQDGVEWFSDEFLQGGIYPGFVFELKGDTTKGFIEYKSRTDMQNKVVFYRDLNDKKSKVIIKPETVRGYKVAGKEYRAIHYSGGLSAGPVKFLLIKKVGRISLYTWFDEADNYHTMRKGSYETQAAYEVRLYPSKEIVAKLNEKPIELSLLGMSYTKKFSEMTADYPEFSKKVADEEEGYGSVKIYENIDEYNKYWANKK